MYTHSKTPFLVREKEMQREIESKNDLLSHKDKLIESKNVLIEQLREKSEELEALVNQCTGKYTDLEAVLQAERRYRQELLAEKERQYQLELERERSMAMQATAVVEELKAQLMEAEKSKTAGVSLIARESLAEEEHSMANDPTVSAIDPQIMEGDISISKALAGHSLQGDFSDSAGGGRAGGGGISSRFASGLHGPQGAVTGSGVSAGQQSSVPPLAEMVDRDRLPSLSLISKNPNATSAQGLAGLAGFGQGMPALPGAEGGGVTVGGREWWDDYKEIHECLVAITHLIHQSNTKIKELESKLRLEKTIADQEREVLHTARAEKAKKAEDTAMKSAALATLKSRYISPGVSLGDLADIAEGDLPSLRSLSKSSSKSASSKKWWDDYKDINVSLEAITHLRTFGPAVIKTLREVIRNGADVCYQGPDMKRPVLHTFIEKRLTECVEVCLETPHPIDFTITDGDGYTPLLLIARRSCYSTSKCVEILRLVLSRLERNPLKDKIDWGQKSKNGFDFVSIAADYQRLSRLFPIVRLEPYFRDQKRPIPLSVRIYETDWEDLGPDRRRFFDPEKGIRS